MPRRSSGGGFGSRSAPRPAAARPSPKPAKHSSPPAPAPAPAAGGGSVLGDLGDAIADGVAFGFANAMVDRAIDFLFGPRTIRHGTVESASVAPAPSSNAGDACGNQSKAFQDCVNNYGSDITKCQIYVDALNECRMNSGSVMGA